MIVDLWSWRFQGTSRSDFGCPIKLYYTQSAYVHYNNMDFVSIVRCVLHLTQLSL